MTAPSSKAWDWSQVPMDTWNDVSDEFLPVALRWKESGGTRVMDLGCGRGRLSLFLAEMGFTVTAVDLSPDGIAQLTAEAERRGLRDRIRPLVCDMLALPFAERSFDFVLGFHSIYHATHDGLERIVAEIRRELAPAGRAFLTFNSKSSPSFRDPANMVVSGCTVVKTEGFEKGIPHTYLDYDDIRRLLSAFQIRKIQHIQDFFEDGTGFHYFVEAERGE